MHNPTIFMSYLSLGKYFIHILLLFFVANACSEDQQVKNNPCHITVSLETQADTIHVIHAETICKNDTLLSAWPLPYPVYRFDCADVDGDGMADIAVGVVKTTRYDPLTHRRLFLFKLFDGHIRPLWLGSRVAQPLVDFILVKDSIPALIRTVEKEQDSSFLVAEYKWKSFGLNFVRYLKRNVSKDEAMKMIE